jgi:EAL domain-containing protein (putative c-di-GMP-specific phosphodiesterase class I)
MSVGIAVTQDASLGAAELLRRADQAMYDAKGSTDLPLALHDARLERRSDTRQRLGRLLEQALETGFAPGSALTLRSRPIQELGGSGALGSELWPELQVPGEPTLAGAELLLLAERFGLGLSLGRWLHAGALEWLERQPEGGTSLVALRLSRAELDEAGLSHGLATQISAQGVDPGRIALQLTDDLLRDPPCALEPELQALGRLGLGLVFDDFGAASTPLQALARLPLTAVRLPSELCGGDSGDARLRQLGGATIRLARDLGLEVIAQGIASESQRQELQRLGCRWGQGPLFDPLGP